MKKSIILFMVFLLIFMSGCKSSEGTTTTYVYDEVINDAMSNRMSINEIRELNPILPDISSRNLTFNNTEISVPSSVDNMPVLKCEYNMDSPEKIESLVLEAVSIFSPNEEYSKDDITYIYKNEDYDNVEVSCNEASEEIKNIRGVLRFYNDNTCAMLFRTSYMMELGHSHYIAESLGCEEDKSWGTRPYYSGSTIETYYIQDENIPDISYELQGGKMSIKEAIELAEDIYDNKIPLVGSPLLVDKVSSVEVMKLNNGKYSYNINFESYYKGIMINDDMGTTSVEGERGITPFIDHHKLSIIEKGQVDYIWSCAHCYDSIIEDNTVDKFITPEYACKLLSSKISEEQVFNIDEIAVVYQSDFCYLDENDEVSDDIQYVSCHPVYRFIVKDPKLPGYNTLYFFVDAINGRVSCNYN